VRTGTDSVPQAVRTDNFLSTIHTGFISRIGSVLEQLKINSFIASTVNEF